MSTADAESGHPSALLLRPGTYPVVVENPDFGWGSVSVGGHLMHLGIRDPVSNPFQLLVTVKKASSATRRTTQNQP
jgi:hypothetical protein